MAIGGRLHDVDRALADDVTAEDRARGAVDDELAEAGRPAVDDRARRRVEAHHRHHHVVRLARLRLGQAHLGVLGVGEAADRTDTARRGRHRLAAHGVGRGDEAVLHAPAAPASAARSRRRRRRCAARTFAGARRRARSPARRSRRPAARGSSAAGVGRPAHRQRRRARPRRCPARRPSRSSSARRPASSRTTRWRRSPRAPRCPRRGKPSRDRRGHVLVLGRQDARARLEQLHARAEGVEDRGDLHAGRAAADDQHRGRNRGQAPRRRCASRVSSKPGMARRRLTPPVQRMIFSALEAAARSRSRSCAASTKRAAPACSCTVTPAASICARRRGVRAHLVHHLAHAREQRVDSPARARPRRCRSARAAGRRAAAARRGPASAPAPVRRGPPCRRTRRA